MSIRIERANSQIQKAMGLILQNKLNNPNLNPMLYISEVNVTPDFKYCKIKVSLDSDNESELEKNIKILQNAQGFIKHELAKLVNMPSVPKLIFVLDKGTRATIRVNEILSKLNIPKEDGDDNNAE